MSSETKVEIDLASLGFWLPVFIWVFFFMRGCTGGASPFDEYLKAAYGVQYEGVKYEATVDPRPEEASTDAED